MDVESIADRYDMPFVRWLGMRFLTASPECVMAELLVRDELCNHRGVLHGGALMAFADTLGACATSLNLPEGASTTTVESKTNFLAASPAGTKLIGESLPLHRGRRSMVWETRITSTEGRLVAVVIQTQLVIAPERA
jgi:uncharacterized protein (TIGR00369 family)